MNARLKATKLRHRELSVLTATARVELSESDRAQLIAATAQPVDWQVVLTAAEAHGVSGLLHRHIAAAGAGVPKNVLADLARLAFASTTKGLAAAHQLRGVIELLATSGIPALPLKGPILAAAVYGDVSLRGISCDLDLLVAHKDYDRARSLLMSAGYTRRIVEGGELHDDACDLLAPNHGATIDLHTSLVGNPGTRPMNVPAILSRCQQREILGASLPVMSPEDQLLYLCLHGAKHMFARLLWIADLAALIRSNPDLQWNSVIEHAHSLAARRRLALGLLLAQRLLGAPIPEEVQQQLFRDRTLRLLYFVALRRLTVAAGGTVPPTLPLLVSGELALREQWSERRAYIARNFQPNVRDELSVELPPALAWLRYVTRPVRILHRYTLRPVLLRLRARMRPPAA